MHPENFPIARVFHPTREWKRLFAFYAFTWSVWPLLAIFVAEMSLGTGPLFNPITGFLWSVGAYLAFLWMIFFIFSLFTKPIRHVITSEGITFCSLGYRIYTPWNNIRGVGTSHYGIYRPRALLLQEPAVKGIVRDGVPLERATVQRRRWLADEKSSPSDAIPLLFTVPANWQESELGLAIKNYAPQAF